MVYLYLRTQVRKFSGDNHMAMMEPLVVSAFVGAIIRTRDAAADGEKWLVLDVGSRHLRRLT